MRLSAIRVGIVLLASLSAGTAASQDAMFVDSSGNVGIGTNTPLAPLHVGAGSQTPRLNATTIMAQTNGDTGLTFRDSRIGVEVFLLAEGSSANPGGVFGTLDAFPFEIRTSNSPRIHIAAGGNIGLAGVRNATSPIQHSNGALLTTGGAWQDASSRELKKNIIELSTDEAVSAVNGLKPVTFEYRAGGDQRVGFIAEDVPQLVATTSRKTLSAMEIAAVLTKAVQAQQQENSRLREHIRTLEARLDQLESRTASSQ